MSEPKRNQTNRNSLTEETCIMNRNIYPGDVQDTSNQTFKDDHTNDTDQCVDELVTSTSHFGLYQAVLLVTIWWCQVTAIGNEVFMVFGSVAPTASGNQNSSLSNITGSLINSTSVSDFRSITVEWGLTGRLSYIPSLITSLQLVGSLFGSLIGGMLADKYGRKKIVIISLSLLVTIGTLSGIVPSWQLMLVARIAIGLFNGMYLSVAVVYVMENINSEMRLPVEASIECINSFGFCWLSLLAFLTLRWDWLSFIVNLQVFPALLLLIFFARESPRWLVKEDKKSSMRVLAYISKLNGRPIERTDDQATTYSFSAKESEDTTHSKEKDFSVKELKQKILQSPLFKSKAVARNTAIIILTYFVTGTIGFGFIFNTGNLVGSIYLNFALLAACNMIAAIGTSLAEHLTRKPLRRKVLHLACLSGVIICLAGVTLLHLLTPVSGEDQNYTLPAVLLNAASILGSMSSVPLWTVSTLYANELSPTAIRNGVTGAGFMAARTGGAISPQFVGYIASLWPPAPYIVFIALSVINMFLVWLFAPESCGEKLPETIEDVEHLDRK